MAPSAPRAGGDRRPVIEVDHGRRGATGGDGVGLGVVPDERRHLVAVIVEFGQYVRSDEAGCTGECHIHSWSSNKRFKRLLEFISGTSKSCRALRWTSPAPEGPGEWWDEQSLDLLLGLVPLSSRPTEGQAEFSIPATKHVRKISSGSGRPVRAPSAPEPRRHESGRTWRRTDPTRPVIRPGPRDDAHHGTIMTSHREGDDHRPGERRRQFVERGLRAELAHRFLLGVQVVLERVLDRRVGSDFREPKW